MGRRKAPQVPAWTPPRWLTAGGAGTGRFATGGEAADPTPRMIPGIGTYANDQITVRTVRGEQATKRYDCPVCNQSIPVGSPHVVVVPDDAPDHRRHFHTACWRTRSTRRPGRS